MIYFSWALLFGYKIYCNEEDNRGMFHWPSISHILVVYLGLFCLCWFSIQWPVFNCRTLDAPFVPPFKCSFRCSVCAYMSLSKREDSDVLIFKSQFSYCPLIWIFHSRTMNNKINCLHERYMYLIYRNKTSSFEELLEQDKSVSIHTRNLQMLVTEIFSVMKYVSSDCQ